MLNNMDIQEIRDIKKHGYNPNNIIEPSGQILNGLIIISNGNKELHDSGYPFIKIYGIIKEGLVDLGGHDHYVCYEPVNIDSFGKNIFHLMLWCNKSKKLKVSDNFMSCSTFEIGDMYDKDDNFIYVD
jgi:hypothetical protein